MKFHKYAGASLLAAGVLLSAGVAFAQSVPTSVTFSSSAATTPSAGTTQAAVASFNVSGPQGTAITSIPFSVAATSGAVPSNLTNCRVFDANGNALGAAFNPTGTSASQTTFSLSTPYNVQNVPAAWTIRCDVASATPAGAQFQFAAGIPTTASSTTTTTGGTTTGTVTPAGQLSVQFLALPTVPAGGTNEALGIVTLSAAGSVNPVVVSSLPMTVNPNGASISALRNCTVRNITNLSGSLGTATSGSTGALSFTLSSPITINAGSQTSLAIVCDVDPSAPAGSTFSLAITPGSVGSTANGTTITPTGAVSATGSSLPTSGVVTVGVPNTGTGGTGTPGAPNTGSGGNASMAVLLLALSGLLAVGGSLFLERARQ